MKFSYFKKQINPESEPYHLVGFGKTREPREEFFGQPELWLKICWLTGDQATQLVFITLDTLYFSKNFTTELYDTFFIKYGLKQEQIIFNASHTHSAPNISVPSWDEINIRYSQQVKERIYEGMDHCSKTLEEGAISCQEIQLSDPLFINRRKKVFSLSSPLKWKVKRLPNTKAEVDNAIRTFTLYNQSGKPEVVIYNVACHPVFNRNLNYSSDFVGVVSDKIEEHVPMAMFLQGFSGDIRANYYGNLDSKSIQTLFGKGHHPRYSLVSVLRLLLNGKIFIPYTQKFFHWFANEISSTIIADYQSGEKTTRLRLSSHSFTFSLKSESGNTQREFMTAICKLNECAIIAIPAEVNSGYYLALKKQLGQTILFNVGCSYDMIGYLPMDTEVKDGGYEVESYANYGWDSRISEQSLHLYKGALINNCINT